jgi:hypothetical protein
MPELHVIDLDLGRAHDLARDLRDGLRPLDLHGLILVPQVPERVEKDAAQVFNLVHVGFSG